MVTIGFCHLFHFTKNRLNNAFVRLPSACNMCILLEFLVLEDNEIKLWSKITVTLRPCAEDVGEFEMELTEMLCI
jgi:hypothetical protein